MNDKNKFKYKKRDKNFDEDDEKSLNQSKNFI